MRLVRRVLREHEPLTVAPGEARRAAVLVPLCPVGDDGCELVLTRRTTTLESHAGQVSFPGGGIDPHDACAEAGALREMHEELGVAPSQVEVLGRLDEMLTITGFHIVPVVGVVARAAVIVPAPSEVARVFTVPLEDLVRRSAWELRRHEYGDRTYEVWHFPYAGEDVWGATARMLRGFVELLWQAGGVKA